ncbi:PREDICTED: uncharacterized protein LOC100642016 [Amphimedon queenslandica]|uniref:Uncharacterized protein n=1 Tax=Amphimedon queenslandica TaxID=400682 RepID=A0A1X7UT84_AMPQE|nr:PREDICTED: uncharacterized protein LOC100642016 [Amphimedon queenslandica]|eukprot:XP_003386849.1 PREDICTED: uncharacterized protein LOC100642016 [Amphimedon queenslandica]
MSGVHPQQAKNVPMMVQPVPVQMVPSMAPYQPGMMQYAMAPPVVHLQSEFVPNDYFIPTLVIAIVCPIMSFSTIFFTVAAIICSILSWMHRAKGVQYYLQAKRFGQAALLLDIIALLWLFAWGFFVLSYLSYIAYISPFFS